jgi:hypothetical protein
MAESITHTDESTTRPKPWDPFQLMDRMDEEALRRSSKEWHPPTWSTWFGKEGRR